MLRYTMIRERREQLSRQPQRPPRTVAERGLSKKYDAGGDSPTTAAMETTAIGSKRGAQHENTDPSRVCSAGTFDVGTCGQLAENDAR